MADDHHARHERCRRHAENSVRFLAMGCVSTNRAEIANLPLQHATYIRRIWVSIDGTKIRDDDETEIWAGAQDFYFFAHVNELVIDVW